MNDKSIRKILVEYIRYRQYSARIFHEKYIGNAICDVMVAVEDVGLIGYEIKSDLDNYVRLDGQIRAYDSFFDYNYIVVGEQHKTTVGYRIPSHWGILVIGKTDLKLIREAKENPSVERSRQLSMLWAVELKNLLARNNMPMYAQRDKSFITDRLVETIPKNKLGLQIVSELLSRDYSIFNTEDKTDKICDDLLEKSSSFPLQELLDMVSEQDEEFTLANWISLFNKGRQLRETKNRLRLKAERIPHRIPYTDIEVSLGAPWISPSIVKDFIIDLLNVEDTFGVYYEKITGHWSITRKTNFLYNVLATSTYGTSDFNAIQIIEATLNLRPIKRKTEVLTLAALEKQKLIRAKFSEWIWMDEDRRWEVEEKYNNMFPEGTKPAKTQELSFAEMNPEMRLFEYQLDAIRHILSCDNSLLAFDVGAGKTYVMIAAAMEMRKSGISEKNLFVVPNNIVGQWEKMFSDLYPTAKVLAVDPKSFKPEIRQKILTQIRDGDYDGIIMAYSCFEMIGLSIKSVNTIIQTQLDQIKLAIDECIRNQYKNGYESFFEQSWRTTQLHKEKTRITDLVSGLFSDINSVTSGITFDELGINTLFVDEAHNFKNLPIRTSLKNVRGLNVAGSDKCQQMLLKIRSVQQANGGRGIVFATGTPLCNSIADAFVMQTYLQPKRLADIGLTNFDDWVKTFAVPEQVCEIDVTASGYRLTQRFSRFQNLPELSELLSEICVFHAMTDEKGLPYFENYSDVIIEKSPALSSYMQELLSRAEMIRKKNVHPSKDNMLKVSTDGRKAALDLTLVDRKQTYDESSKITRCIQEVLDLFTRYEGCSQLIFCDLSTPKTGVFNVYKELKDRLVEKGVPSRQIAFIHSFTNEQSKLKLYDAVNKGTVRVLIGSTFKLGIGANVQTRLKAIHHLDIPWRPADMVQREGRIIRRGNENEEVFIYRYIAQGSFDSYSWQILETKQRFISQFLSGSTYQRKASDLDDNVLTYAEAKALALDAPEVKALAEKENELRYYTILHAKEQEDREKMTAEIAALEKTIEKKTVFLSHTKENAAYIASVDAKLLESALPTAGERLYLMSDHSGEVGSIASFSLSIEQRDGLHAPFLRLSRADAVYTLELGETPQGNAARLRNFFKRFPLRIEETEKEILADTTRLNALRTEIQKPFLYPKEVERCEKEAEAIRSSLGVKYQ